MKHIGIAIGIAIGATIYSLIIWLIGGVISSLKKARRLEKLIEEVIINPCQMTAQNLYEGLSKLSALNRRLFKNGGQGAIKKTRWRDLYNNYIQPSNAILPETKKGIHNALMGIGVYNLTTGNNGSVYNAQQRGDLGEDNVWHTLTVLAKRENCNIFHSVRVGADKSSQEIDNVIVSPKGIFLIEVKSVTHKPINPYDGSDVVIFDDLPENPYQQIYDHETEFVKTFGLEGTIKNLLVMSYPHDEKKKIDISTFPTDTIYTTLKVDDLLEYYMKYNSDVVLDDTTIAHVSQELSKCKNYRDGVLVTKFMFNDAANIANTVSEGNTNLSEQQAKFCPQCGNKLSAKTPFCPNCGSKLS